MHLRVNGVFDVAVPVVLVISVTVVPLIGGLAVRADVGAPDESN